VGTCLIDCVMCAFTYPSIKAPLIDHLVNNLSTSISQTVRLLHTIRTTTCCQVHSHHLYNTHICTHIITHTHARKHPSNQRESPEIAALGNKILAKLHHLLWLEHDGHPCIETAKNKCLGEKNATFHVVRARYVFGNSRTIKWC